MSIGCKNHICEIPIQQCAQKHVYSYKPLIKKMIPSENMIDSIAFDINWKFDNCMCIHIHVYICTNQTIHDLVRIR